MNRTFNDYSHYFMKLPVEDLRFFTTLIKDYISQNDLLKPYYNRFPSIESFHNQLVEKSNQWDKKGELRQTLTTVLLDQYKAVINKQKVEVNIEALKNKNTFTITTGHQLNLFTGPLYFLYKIISTINLCKELKERYPEYNFVPIYWMATEDHDFDEIKYFNFNEKRVVYERESTGAVGRLDLNGIDSVYEVLDKTLGNHDHAISLKKYFKESYLEHDNLADATRFLAHSLFKDEGLVILDADNYLLKQSMVPYFKEELIEQTSFHTVSKTIESWPEEYNIQVNPREINLFYLTNSHRKRIIEKEGVYYIDDTNLSFSKDDILQELENFPERFSPNVILRPLYQEVILPNLCYIGGGGELAYWLELKSFFDSQNVTFPLLLLRNSALIVTEKQSRKIKKLSCNLKDFFETPEQLSTIITNQITDVELSFDQQRYYLQEQFKALYIIAEQTDKSFIGAVAAQEKKQLKGLDNLEKRLLKAQKYKYNDQIERAFELQNTLFPKNSLQERQSNFADFYTIYGSQFIEILKQELQPLDPDFSIITLKD